MNLAPKRRLIVLAVASAFATVGLVWLAVTSSGELPGWARAAAASPLAMRCLVIMIIGMAALGVILVVLVRARPRSRPAGFRGFFGDQGGTAAIEMAFVFPLGLMIFLVIIQAALAFNANMVVHYAAFAAARMAVVVVPLDLQRKQSGWPDTQVEIQNRVLNTDPAIVEAGRKSDKLELIRRAAVLAVMPISARAASGSPVTDQGGQAIRDESARVFKHFGVDKRPWFGASKGDTSFQPLFGRAKAQYDYANGKITAQGSPVDVTKIELMKPDHWRTPPEAHQWKRDSMDGGFTEEDWDLANRSNLNEDCPYTVTVTEWDYTNNKYNTHRRNCPEFENAFRRLDYNYWEPLNIRLTYQFLLEMPYANRFLGDVAGVPGFTGKQYATQIRVVVSFENEGEPEIPPVDYR